MPRLRSNIIAVYIVRPAGPDPADGIELLMLQRPEGHRFAGAWQTVGGHIEEKQGETAWQAAIRETNEETCLEVERWFRIDRPESFYNPENDTIYFVPAFAALVARDAEPVLSEEHQAWKWQTPNEAAHAVDWAAMRDSILLVGEAFSDPEQPGLGVSEFDPEDLRRP
ncbi:MAG: NUDIX domain-containing protein [Chloroflexi bacterium]|nr:NUDIX domain-containing protein [Chloroflexota bacterium]